MNIPVVDILALLVSLAAFGLALRAECGVRSFRREYEEPLARHQLHQAEREERERLLADLSCSTVHRKDGKKPSVTITNRGRHDALCVTFADNPPIPFAHHPEDFPAIITPDDPFELYLQNPPPSGFTLTATYDDGAGHHPDVELLCIPHQS